MEKEKLAAILTAHSLWLSSGFVKGKRAHLQGADLRGAYLQGAYLRGADLQGADLRGAYLQGAYLRGAHLQGADLQGAYLRGAYLRGADLQGADLQGAYLRGADLQGADLRGAYLQGAYLQGADLRGAYLQGAKNLAEAKNAELVLAQTSIVPQQGSLEGWKKCEGGVLVRLLIPAKAKRSSATGRKCRAEYAKVLEVVGAKVGISEHDSSVTYTKGKTVKCHEWNEDRFEECGGGIHFFLTKIEAENY